MDIAKNDIQESNFTLSHDKTDKFRAHKKRMPIIKCSCGFKILAVPDLKAMNRAIKKHVANHKKASIGSERLTAFLTEQVLIVAAKLICQL